MLRVVCCKRMKDGFSYLPLTPITFFCLFDRLIVLGFNDVSTSLGHFVSSPREREKRERNDSRGDERKGQGRKREKNESEETEEIKHFPLPLPAARISSCSVYLTILPWQAYT